MWRRPITITSGSRRAPGPRALYAIFLLRRGFREDSRINYCLLLGGAAFHTMEMFQRALLLQRCPTNPLYEATLFIAWTIGVSYRVLGAWS